MINQQHIELIKGTIPVLRENGVALTSYFYKRMLGNHPELRNVFNLDHQSTGRQSRAQAATLLAYAENIENPDALVKAFERIAKKHVSLDIQPEQYSIVGENLLHSISEVLNVPMESELIQAWKEAYVQLADILIKTEKDKYDALTAQHGGWAGWREFEIENIQASEGAPRLTLKASDQQAILPATSGQYISIKIQVPGQDVEQPQQFSFSTDQNGEAYSVEVKAEANPTIFSVANILLDHYKVGDKVLVSAPL